MDKKRWKKEKERKKREKKRKQTEDLGKGLETEALSSGLAHDDEGGSTVVDRGGVGGSDGTVLVEGGSEGGELGKVDLGVLLVNVDDLVALLALDGHGYDLVLEVSSLQKKTSVSVFHLHHQKVKGERHGPPRRWRHACKTRWHKRPAAHA